MALSAGSPEEAEGLSAFVQGDGYAAAAAFTFAFGVLHDLSGGWGAPIGLLVVLTAVVIPAAVVLARGSRGGDGRES